MATNQFVAKHGLISNGDVTVSGSIIVTGNITASNFSGTASAAASASYLNEGANIYLSQSYISSVTGSTQPAFQPATMWWDDNAKTYAIYGDDPNSALQIGQEQWIRSYAHEYIPNGSPVYVHDSLNGLPCVKLALASGVFGSNKSSVIGIATNNIDSGSIGIITSLGQVHDLDTSMFAAGQDIYLSSAESGSIVGEAPPQPHEVVQLGYVLVSDSTNGIIQVNITNVQSNIFPFVGLTVVPTITTGSNGLLTVGTGSVNFSVTADGTGPVRNYQIPSASFTLNTSSLSSQYIVTTYNSGSPIYQLTSDDSSVDEIQTSMVATAVYRSVMGVVSLIDWDAPGNLLANKLLNRANEVFGAQRADGLTLGVSSSLYSTITSGSVWNGSKKSSLDAVNSFTNRMVLLAHSSSVWSASIVTQLNNTQCDDGGNIVALGSGNNHWVSNYVYRGIGNLNTTIVMLSGDFDSLTNAKLGQPPTPPAVIYETSVLVGRVIYKKGIATPEAIESAFVVNFSPAGASVHNDLNGLQGGTSGEYYHLPSASYAQLSNGTASYSINSDTASYLTTANNYTVNQLTASNISASKTGSFGDVRVLGDGIVSFVGNSTAKFTPDLNVNGTARSFRFSNNTSATNEGFQFYSDSSNTNLMFIANSGKVGIGTTTPSASLQINTLASATSSALIISQSLPISQSIATPILDMQSIWSGSLTNVYSGIKYNVIDSGSALSSKYIDIQRNGSSMFSITRDPGGSVWTKMSIGENANAGCIISNYNTDAILLRPQNNVFGLINQNICWSTTATNLLNLSANAVLMNETGSILSISSTLTNGKGTNGTTTFANSGLRVYNWYSSSNDYERANNYWSGSAYYIATEFSSSGVSLPRDIIFQTSGSNRMFMSASGKIGIGTTTPVELLSLAGGYGTGVSLNNAAGLKWQLLSGVGSSNSAFGIGTGLPLSPGPTSTPVIYINGSGTSYGYVGIGTALGGPSAKLHVSGSLISETLFKIEAVSGSNILFVSSSGNVGIGTITPTNPLDISTAGHTYLSLRAGTTGTTANIRFYDRTFTNWTVGYRNLLDTPNHRLAFNWSNNGGKENFTITTASYVGINISNPTARLHISGSDVNESEFLIQNSSGTNLLFVSSSGNIGIGTTAPANKLDVVGNVSCSVITASVNATAIVAGITTQTTNYALTTSDYTVIMSGSTALSASLPVIPITGSIYNIKNVSPYYVTVTGSQNIDNSNNQIINQWSTLTIQYGGTQWYII